MWRAVERFLYASSYALSLIVLTSFLWGFKTFNSPEFFLDIDYLHWTSPLPAVSFCQAYPSNSSDSRATAFLKNLLRPEDVYCKGCDVMEEDEFPLEDYTAILFKYTLSCGELFSKCFWNGESVDCCQRVTEVLTVKGRCYTFNAHTLRNELKFSVSHFTKDSLLEAAVTAPVQVFVHDPKDTMFITKGAPVAKHGTKLDILYSSREVQADQSAWGLTLKQRGCVLQGEYLLPHFGAYSEDACMLERLIINQMKLCNCTHHLLPNAAGLHKPKFKKKKTKNRCRPACDEIEVKLIRASLENADSQDIRVTIEQTSPPKERLILKARVGPLDIFVGVACFSRLFTSTSYLGLVNALLVRPNRRILQYYSYRQLLY